MRNIPMFTTDLGVASLVLDQIPYRQTAYVHIQDTAQLTEFADECRQFCRAAGADYVLAAGNDGLKAFPLAYEIITMVCPLESMADTDVALMPVTEETLSQWLEVYNQKMVAVDGATYMSIRDGKVLLEEGSGYFIHKDGEMLGIGKAAGETLDALATVVPGAGEIVVLALCHALSGPLVQVQVASTNQRGIRLYERMGFVPTKVEKQWYRLL